MIELFEQVDSNKTILLPKGTHKINSLLATEQYVYITNNDSGLKRIALLIENKDNVVIDGQHSTWLFNDGMVPIVVKNSKNVVLKNFTIDWEKPFFFQGEVVNICPEEDYFDLKIMDEVTYYINDSILYFMGKKPASDSEWAGWSLTTNDKKTWVQNIQWNMWFEKSGVPVYNEHEYNIKPNPKVKELEPGLVRFFGATKKMPRIGMTLTLKGKMNPNRNYPAIVISESQNVVVEQVTVHHAGGMGLVAQRCENIHLKQFNVQLPPNSKRLCSTTADATHFNGCKGKVIVENCYFENMLDDSMNVHGTFVKVTQVLDEHRFLARLMHAQQVGLTFASNGDTLRAYQNDNLELKATITVRDINVINNEMMLITTHEDLRNKVLDGMLVDNETWQPEVIYRNNTVKNNRARGILLHSGKTILVENNIFDSCSMQGIRLDGDGTFWHESGSCKDVIIKNNLFKNVMNYIVETGPKVNSDLYPNARYHQNITFENNVIQTFHNKYLNLKAVDKFNFVNNSIECIGDCLITNTKPSYNFIGSSHVTINNNQYQNVPLVDCKIDQSSHDINKID